MKKGFSKFAETALCVLVIAAAVVLVAIGKADAAQAYDGWMSICDVPSDRGDIFSLTESGVLPLYEAGGAYYFRPDADVTREYIASAAARALGLDKNKYGGVPLGVIDEAEIEPSWLGYVKAAAFDGVMTVFAAEDGKASFRPKATVTRAQAAKILSSMIYAAASTTKVDDFSDRDDIPSDCLAAIEKLVALDVFQGNGDGKFRPNDNITNEELSLALYKMIRGGYIKK